MSPKIRLVLAFAAIALAFLTLDSVARAQTCGVLEFTGGGSGITKNVVVNITSLVVSEADIGGEYEFTMQHSADEFDNGCPGSTSCLAKFATNNGYGALIIGSVTDGTKPDHYKIKMRLFDPSDSSWLRTVVEEIHSAPSSMVVDLPPMVTELITGTRPRTAAEVMADAEEDDMALDMDVDLFEDIDDEEEEVFGGFADEDDLSFVDLDMSREEAEAKREEERQREEEREAREEDRRRAEDRERREREDEERRAEERERRDREDDERRAEEERERREEDERRRSYEDEEEDDSDFIIISDADEIIIGDDDDDDDDDYGRSSSRYDDDEDDYGRSSSRYDDEDDDRDSRKSSRYDDEDDDYDYGRYDDEDDDRDSRKSSRYDDEDDYDSRKSSRYDDEEDDYGSRSKGSRYDDDEDDYDSRRSGRNASKEFDEGGSSSRGSARYSGEEDVAHVCIKASAGGVYYYQGFFSYGGDIGIHLHKNMLLDLQFKGWTAQAKIITAGVEEIKTVTLIPLSIGASYKSMRGPVHPYIGGDAVFVLYQVHPDTGARFAPGFKVRGGADFKLTESFGLFVGANVGFAYAKHIQEIDSERVQTQFIFDATAGFMIQL